MANFKLALSAGHGKNTPGKRCLKSLDPGETREWVLNSRIAVLVEKMLLEYEGIEILRLDDTTGVKDVSIYTRTDDANKWGADFYLAIHHNAGVKGGKGGGIVAYIARKASATSAVWQEELYNALIAKTGLKGNRSTPLAKADFVEIKRSVMPAVLLELGFMDSAVDVPLILTENYAHNCAAAIVETIVQEQKLQKKIVERPKPTEPEKEYIYRVQVGAYSNLRNAEVMLDKLKRSGFSGIITKVEK